MALKTIASTSVHKSELKSEPTGYLKAKSLSKVNYNPKKVASGNVSSVEVGLKTEASSGGLK